MAAVYELPKRSVLRDFQSIYRAGKSYANRMVVVYVLPNSGGERRVGFAAGKKLGKAVIRNRVKRLLREAYRLNQHRLREGVDLVFVGRQATIESQLPAVSSALLHVCGRAGLLVEQG